MAATKTAMYSQNSSQTGTTVAGAFPQTILGQDIDLLQIVDKGGAVLVNVDYTGGVHGPASSPTKDTRIGKFLTRLASGQSTAAYFADAFTNPSKLDILQVINKGGNIHYYLNYAGAATGT